MRSYCFNPLKKLAQFVAVFFDESCLQELVVEAEELTVDTTELLQIHRRETKLFDCPLSPTPHVIFGPSSRICIRQQYHFKGWQ